MIKKISVLGAAALAWKYVPDSLINSFCSNIPQIASAEESKISERQAICILRSEPNQKAKGIVRFTHRTVLEPLKVEGKFDGLQPNSKHGFHIHQFGNLQNGCVTAGPHYNPKGQTHGGPDEKIRHAGDYGNVQSDGDGNGTLSHVQYECSLFGDSSIVGRACVLHRNEDDLGKGGNQQSKKTGNAGVRIACGVIGLCNW